MNIEFSITVWPIVSLLLCFLTWAVATCVGCMWMVTAWADARKTKWFAAVAAVCMACLAWFVQWYFGLYLREWLKIVF